MGQSKSSRRRRRKRKSKGGATDVVTAETHQADTGETASPAGTLPSVNVLRSAPQQPFRPPKAQAQNSPQRRRALGGRQRRRRWNQALEKEVPRPRPRPPTARRQPRQSGNGSSGSANGQTSNRNGGGGGGFSSGADSTAGSGDSHQFGNRVEGWKSRKGAAVAANRVATAGRAASSVPWITATASSTATSPIRLQSTIEPRHYGGNGRPRSYHSQQRLPAHRLLPGPRRSHPRRRPHQDLLLHRRPLLHRQNPGDRPQTRRQSRLRQKRKRRSIAKLTGGEEEDRPGLIVFDLNNANAKPLTLIPKLKAKLKRSTSIVGFLSHLQGDLKAKAVEAGCDTVMPRAAFSQNLPNLLRRYGLAEEKEEANFNQ